MPTVGLGTDKLIDTLIHPKVIYDAIVEGGYRLLDCATVYKNEELVGQAIDKAIKENKVTREDLFIITKLDMNDFADPERALKESLTKLKVDYVDTYLIHWPAAFFTAKSENRIPLHVLWPRLEALVEKGYIKSIGVSNFNVQILCDMLLYCKIKPVMN